MVPGSAAVCLIVIALGSHPDLPFVLAGNRDEFHARPTRAAGPWDDHPDILGGRDLEQGGTWLAVSRRGALATVTNYRDPTNRVTGARSRGLLVGDFVAGNEPPGRYVPARTAEGRRHDGFNLVAADATGVWWGSNRGGESTRLGRGIHALSNHLLGTPWPKVRRLREGLADDLDAPAATAIESLFDRLRDTRPVDDADLPSTGVSLEWERLLGPPFIVSPTYGTRSTTVVTIDHAGQLRFEERSFGPDGAETGRTVHSLALPRPIGP